jgi:hypothetical protein
MKEWNRSVFVRCKECMLCCPNLYDYDGSCTFNTPHFFDRRASLAQLHRSVYSHITRIRPTNLLLQCASGSVQLDYQSLADFYAGI